jgi:hypothetical protein
MLISPLLTVWLPLPYLLGIVAAMVPLFVRFCGLF